MLTVTAVTGSFENKKFVKCIWVSYYFPKRFRCKECFLRVGAERVVVVAHAKATAFLYLDVNRSREVILNTCSENNLSQQIRSIKDSVCVIRDRTEYQCLMLYAFASLRREV